MKQHQLSPDVISRHTPLNSKIDLVRLYSYIYLLAPMAGVYYSLELGLNEHLSRINLSIKHLDTLGQLAICILNKL